MAITEVAFVTPLVSLKTNDTGHPLWLGREGIREVAAQSAQKAHYLAKKIAAIPGYSLKYKSSYFREFVVETPIPAAAVIAAMLEKNVFAGYDLAAHDETGLLVAVTEKRTKEELDSFAENLGALI